MFTHFPFYQMGFHVKFSLTQQGESFLILYLSFEYYLFYDAQDNLNLVY